MVKRAFTAEIYCEDNTRVQRDIHARARRWRDMVRGAVPECNASKRSTFCPKQISLSTVWVNMPPDSKDLSSLKDKSPSFYRLHATDLDRMKGIYLSAEELRGFDKYKVTPSIDKCVCDLVGRHQF